MIQIGQDKSVHRIERSAWVVALHLFGCLLCNDRHGKPPYLVLFCLIVQTCDTCLLELKLTCYIQIGHCTVSQGYSQIVLRSLGSRGRVNHTCNIVAGCYEAVIIIVSIISLVT